MSIKLCINLIIISLLVVIPGCKIEALYNARVQKQLSQIFIQAIPNREGQILREELIYLMSEYNNNKYLIYNLNIKLTIKEYNIGRDRNNINIRKNKILQAKIVLVKRKSLKKIYTNVINCQNSFIKNNIKNYSSKINKDYNTKKAIKHLAQLIKKDIAIYFSQNENKISKIIHN